MLIKKLINIDNIVKTNILEVGVRSVNINCMFKKIPLSAYIFFEYVLYSRTLN